MKYESIHMFVQFCISVIIFTHTWGLIKGQIPSNAIDKSSHANVHDMWDNEQLDLSPVICRFLFVFTSLVQVSFVLLSLSYTLCFRVRTCVRLPYPCLLL